MGKIAQKYKRGLLERYLNSKITKMTWAEFHALDDYSCSIPTGTTIGKRWKRRKVYRDESKGWIIGEYIDVGSDSEVGIRWTIPVTIDKAGAR